MYAPNEYNPKFMMDMITLFSQNNTDFGIVAGDFNCCDVDLVDVWRELNPTRKDYIFYSARHKSYSRLDLFFFYLRIISHP